MNIQSFGDRHQGRRRKNNEDFVTWFEPIEPAEVEASGCLYILADGVGGAAKGERASQYAAQKVLHGYYQLLDMEPSERLRQLMIQASNEIFTHTEQSGRFNRMATTMVAAIVRAGKLIVAHVGDSRAYLIRQGVPTQLTRDHSIVGEMIANGDMTEAEAQSSKIKNKLTRSLGGEAQVHVDIHPPVLLQAGDKILLCSDGLTRYALREDIAKLTAEGSPREIVERLIKFANKRGGGDNVSAIIISYGTTEVLESTIRVQRPLQPPNIEDTLDTIPDIRPRRKQVVIPIILFIVLLGVFGVLAFGLATGFPGNLQLSQSIMTSESPVSVIATQTLVSTFPNPLISETPQPSLPIFTPTQDLTQTLTVISTQLTGVDCYYTVQPGDYPISIAEKFGISSDDWKLIECVMPEGCTLDNPKNIRPGWIVRIPNILPNVCESNGGQLTFDQQLP